MAADPRPREKADRRATSPADPSEKRLWSWLSFSFVLHILLISTLFLAPSMGQRRISPLPVYTVELVGGERLGGATTVLETPAAPPKPKPETKARPEPPVEKKTKKPPEPAVAKPKEKAPDPAVTKAKDAMKEIEKPVEQAEPAKGLSDEAREKLIQAALESVKRRVSAQKSSGAESPAEKKAAKEAAGQPVLSGPGEGAGAAAPGEGGTGGGIVKGVEFIVYRNRMLHLIKERWTWIGKRTDLEVTVRFAIQNNGEISGLKIIQSSGDSSFDNSVLRAVRNASPLGAPPENYRADFRDVELTFRPRDLRS